MLASGPFALGPSMGERSFVYETRSNPGLIVFRSCSRFLQELDFHLGRHAGRILAHQPARGGT